MAQRIEKIFLRVPAALKEQWQTVVDETRTPQNQVGTALVEWFISLDRYQRADVLAGRFTPQAHPPSKQPTATELPAKIAVLPAKGHPARSSADERAKTRR